MVMFAPSCLVWERLGLHFLGTFISTMIASRLKYIYMDYHPPAIGLRLV